MLSGVRGGLAVAALAASACSARCAARRSATAATMTRIALPEMRKAGYDDGLATGSLAAGGSLGILIPPSIIMVIYAAIAEQSVPRLFAAGLVPGLVLTGLYIAVAVTVAHCGPHSAPDRRVPLWANDGRHREPWQFIALFHRARSAASMPAYSVRRKRRRSARPAPSRAHRRQSPWAALIRAIESTVVRSCLLFVIIFGANLFSFFMVQTHLPDLLVDIAHGLDLPGPAVIVMIVVAYIVLGCFLEGIGMVLITVPVFLPLVKSAGYDPVWFAVIVVIVVEVGLIHPPVGMTCSSSRRRRRTSRSPASIAGSCRSWWRR